MSLCSKTTTGILHTHQYLGTHAEIITTLSTCTVLSECAKWFTWIILMHPLQQPYQKVLQRGTILAEVKFSPRKAKAQFLSYFISNYKWHVTMWKKCHQHFPTWEKEKENTHGSSFCSSQITHGCLAAWITHTHRLNAIFSTWGVFAEEACTPMVLLNTFLNDQITSLKRPTE